VTSICVVGIGGVGGYFGGKLCRSASRIEADIYFVARGQHLAEIRKNGLQVSTATEGDWVCHPTLATDCIEDLPVMDVCLVCVKSYDLKPVVQQISTKMTDGTAIVPLLNGVDVYERIREELHIARVFPACVFIGTHIAAYGKVEQQGGACKILIGSDPQSSGVVPNQLLQQLAMSDIQYQWFDDVSPALWSKYVFIAAFGLVTASFDKTIGEVMESSHLSAYTRAVIAEIVELSQKKGVALSPNIVSETYEKGREFPFDTRTSIQRDVELMDKPDERDLFGGTILRLGQQLGVATPKTQELWDMLSQRKPLK
jgi:2-dehydropantoate 2-reductase